MSWKNNSLNFMNKEISQIPENFILDAMVRNELLCCFDKNVEINYLKEQGFWVVDAFTRNIVCWDPYSPNSRIILEMLNFATLIRNDFIE